MAQFMVIGRDGSDSEARARRLAARPAHFAGIAAMVEKGEIISGSAILDQAGNMVGSVVIAEFPSRAELDAWLAREPYVTGGVWQKIEVEPVRIAVRDGKITP
jgi:hypothetical protein